LVNTLTHYRRSVSGSCVQNQRPPTHDYTAAVRAAIIRFPMPFIYILQCRDGSLYTGIATDVARRLTEHGAGRASRYTRVRLPVTLAWSRRVRSWSLALREEYRIKHLPRAAKLALVRSGARSARRGR